MFHKISFKKFLYFFTIINTLISLSLFLLPAAQAGQREKKLPPEIKSGIRYLVKLGAGKKVNPVNIKSIEKVLDFVITEKDNSYLYYPENWRDTTRAYYEFDLETDMERLLKYSYNPSIPSQALRPSSLRYSYWEKIDEHKDKLPQLWNLFGDLDKPLVIHGVEQEVITPDANTGAYYANKVERTLILFRHRGKKVFITISHQPDKSDVGKKGAVLAHDEDWNYFYSGIEGLTMKGLGWASSYMYRSFSIAIYYEMDPQKPAVRYAIFKWLRAGWAGMNMVKRTHIANGMKRFVRDYKFILEHPNLPGPKDLASHFENISRLSTEEMKVIAKENISNMIREYGRGDILSRREFSHLLKSGDYLENMNRREVESILVLDYMKKVLGKEYKGTLFWEKK
ncbi:MAG: hypothetical protein OEV42_15815 [Deltaproteobacteria bacterium]|nr:hypothetical protein [Deltaproteobacteria bacterium]